MGEMKEAIDQEVSMKIVMLFIALALVFLLAACSPAVPVPTPAPPAATPVAAESSPTPAPPTPTQVPPTAIPTAAPTTEPAATAQPVAAATLPEVKIDAADFSYSAPEKIPAGWVRVTMTNTGQEPHHVQFLRLNDGVTFQQFEKAFEEAEGPALALTRQVGGVGAVHPGGAASAVLDLPAGDYALVCFIPSPGDGIAHHKKGMIKTLTVGDAGQAAPAAPRADLVVRMKDFGYDLPKALPAGPLTLEVVNDGPEPHELNLLRLPEGKTLNDVMKFLTGEAGGPPPFVPVGGMNGLDQGVTGYAELNLEPGNYVAICNIPSPKNEGHPHFALGMAWPFQVGGSAAAFPAGKFIQAGSQSRALQFNADGTFAALDGETRLAGGTYSVKDGVYTETSNDAGCSSPKSFRFAFDGAGLRFYPVNDPATDECQGRRDDFSPAQTWTLAK
jgi:hypothetical protein